MRIVHFISSKNNIGNFTPVWGIRKLLGKRCHCIKKTLDCRDFAQIRIADFDLAIVGGAGLLHTSFEPFWEFLAATDIPTIVWGVGVCHPTTNTSENPEFRVRAHGVSVPVVQRAWKNCVLANLRDELNRDHYGVDADISYCPTAAFTQKYRKLAAGQRKHILVVEHPRFGLLDNLDNYSSLSIIRTWNKPRLRSISYPLLLQKYRHARVVVTGRLHGMIIANSLGVPYVAVPTDRKMVDYHRLYGGGHIAALPGDIPELVSDLISRGSVCDVRIDMSAIEDFAKRVRGYLTPVPSPVGEGE